jgi:hypothetical protein
MTSIAHVRIDNAHAIRRRPNVILLVILFILFILFLVFLVLLVIAVVYFHKASLATPAGSIWAQVLGLCVEGSRLASQQPGGDPASCWRQKGTG